MRVLLLVTALVFAGSGVAQSQVPPPTPSKDSKGQKSHPAATNDNPANNPIGTDKQPFVVKSLEAEKTPERTEQERPEREEKAANERSLIVGTIVLASATIILALFAGGQIGLFWWQLRIIRESLAHTKEAADAAKTSADAAERSVRIMQDTAERQLRAYIIVEDDEKFLDVLIEDNRTTGVIIRLRLKNVGSTAAYKVHFWYNASILRYPFTGDFQALDFSRGEIYLPPGYNESMDFRFRTHWTIDMLNMDLGDADKIGLYVWGELRYVDAFNKPRFVKFRYVRRVGADPSVEYCDEGNEAD